MDNAVACRDRSTAALIDTSAVNNIKTATDAAAEKFAARALGKPPIFFSIMYYKDFCRYDTIP
jgi:hypothetical protein